MSKFALALRQSDAVHGVQQIISYRFRNELLLWEALQGHRNLDFPHRNLKLAHLGDAALALEVAKNAFVRGFDPGKRLI